MEDRHVKVPLKGTLMEARPASLPTWARPLECIMLDQRVASAGVAKAPHTVALTLEVTVHLSGTVGNSEMVTLDSTEPKELRSIEHCA